MEQSTYIGTYFNLQRNTSSSRALGREILLPALSDDIECYINDSLTPAVL